MRLTVRRVSMAEINLTVSKKQIVIQVGTKYHHFAFLLALQNW